MVFAEQCEVWQVRLTSLAPPLEVMRFGEDRIPTAGKATTSVAPPDLPSLCPGWETALSTFVHRVT